MAVLKTSGRIPGWGFGLSLLVLWFFASAWVDTGSLFCPPASAQELVAPEYKVKAAFLYNFANLTDWPTGTFTNSSQPVVIGVVGRDPFGSMLETTLGSKKLGKRPITIVRFPNARDISGCHLLFVPASEDVRLPSILSQVSGQPILIVGDGEQFAWRGGMIGLISRGDEIHFEINLGAAQKARLKMSSKLLRLAETIVPSGREKGD